MMFKGKYMARYIPEPQFRERRLRWHKSSTPVSTEQTRPPQHGWECMGMDRGLLV